MSYVVEAQILAFLTHDRPAPRQIQDALPYQEYRQGVDDMQVYGCPTEPGNTAGPGQTAGNSPAEKPSAKEPEAEPPSKEL